jgi:hypothetical protein
MDKWNEICFLIEEHKKDNSKESAYQTCAEGIFRLLGWSSVKNEILPKQRISVGAANSIEPDIIIQKDGKKLFVVEMKRPNAKITEKNRDQLFSYMRLPQLKYGICIGDNLEFFYDESEDGEPPVKIFDTTFSRDNEDAANFIKLISKPTFVKEELEAFCEKRLDSLNDKEIADRLVSEIVKNGKTELEKYLFEKLKEEYNDDIIQIIKDKITISISRSDPSVIPPEVRNYDKINSMRTPTEKMPIEIIPADKKEFKSKFLEKGVAIKRFYYQDEKIEEKIWRKTYLDESSNIWANLRSMPIARKGKWKEEGIVKLVVEVID